MLRCSLQKLFTKTASSLPAFPFPLPGSLMTMCNCSSKGHRDTDSFYYFILGWNCGLTWHPATIPFCLFWLSFSYFIYRNLHIKGETERDFYVMWIFARIFRCYMLFSLPTAMQSLFGKGIEGPSHTFLTNNDYHLLVLLCPKRRKSPHVMLPRKGDLI